MTVHESNLPPPLRGFNATDSGAWWLRALAKWAQGRSFRSLTRLGKTVGWWVYHLAPVRRWTVVRRNLRAAFPLLSRRERDAIAQAAYESLGASVFEVLGAPNLLRLDAVSREALVRIDGREHLDAALSLGRGAIVVTAHLGGFDLAACVCAGLVPSLHLVTKRLSAGGLDGFWQSTRAALGVRLHDAVGSMASLLNALKNNGCVVLMVDQRTLVRDGGTLVKFFERDAETTLAPAVLSARSRAPIVMARCVREDDGTHRVSLDAPIAPPGRTRREWVTLTQQITARVEQWVRARPGEWLWLHDRWRRS